MLLRNTKLTRGGECLGLAALFYERALEGQLVSRLSADSPGPGEFGDADRRRALLPEILEYSRFFRMI